MLRNVFNSQNYIFVVVGFNVVKIYSKGCVPSTAHVKGPNVEVTDCMWSVALRGVVVRTTSEEPHQSALCRAIAQSFWSVTVSTSSQYFLLLPYPTSSLLRWKHFGKHKHWCRYCYELTIVATDKILCFINTFIVVIILQFCAACLPGSYCCTGQNRGQGEQNNE